MLSIESINSDLRRRNARTRLEPSSGQGTVRIRYSRDGRLHRLSPGITNDQEGLLEAEVMALAVSQQLRDDCFDPSAWKQRSKPTRQTFHRVIAAYERERDGKGDWLNDYWSIYQQLPVTEPFGAGAMHAVVLRLPKASRQRLRAGIALSALARFQGDEKLARELRELGRGYSSFRSQQERAIPTDGQIEKAADLLPEQWRWGYWAMATYGCRPSETWKAEARGQLLHISGGKTGARLSLPTKVEWLMRFGDRLFPETEATKDNKKLGGKWCKAFKRFGISFTPYALRHAAAIRMIHNPKIKDSIAARSLGHSLAVHTQTYQRWISEAEYLELLG